jgi:hypothetical protein
LILPSIKDFQTLATLRPKVPEEEILSGKEIKLCCKRFSDKIIQGSPSILPEKVEMLLE